MIYPTFNQYRDKLKADKNNINDSVLRAGTVIMDKRNIYPYLITGGRAIVFKIKSGNRLYALKCWNAELLGLEKRFKEIDSYLKTVRLSYFVDFSFNKNGFKGNKKDFFPTLRMEWVDGCTLTDFVVKNYKNSVKIKDVASQFLTMVQELHVNRISHGDLQGGNIMIKQNGDICLIDYDSICVPNLQNEKDNIAGLPGFQHPFNKKSLGLKVDYFSELVIYLSLLVFSENQDLAQNIDDKKWLFSESDLRDPSTSLVFKKLMKMSPDIRNLTTHLIDYCTVDALLLKPLEDIVSSPWASTFSKRNTPTISKASHSTNLNTTKSKAKAVALKTPDGNITNKHISYSCRKCATLLTQNNNLRRESIISRAQVNKANCSKHIAKVTVAIAIIAVLVCIIIVAVDNSEYQKQTQAFINTEFQQQIQLKTDTIELLQNNATRLQTQITDLQRQIRQQPASTTTVVSSVADQNTIRRYQREVEALNRTVEERDRTISRLEELIRILE